MGQEMASIAITITNVASFQRTFRIVDNVAGGQRTLTFSPFESKSLGIVSDDKTENGYGSISYEDINQNDDPVTVELISNGDEIRV
jgi:hypothetical protein